LSRTFNMLNALILNEQISFKQTSETRCTDGRVLDKIQERIQERVCVSVLLRFAITLHWHHLRVLSRDIRMQVSESISEEQINGHDVPWSVNTKWKYFQLSSEVFAADVLSSDCHTRRHCARQWLQHCIRSVAGYIEIHGSVNWEAVSRSLPPSWPRQKMTVAVTAAMHPRMCMHILGCIAAVTFL